MTSTNSTPRAPPVEEDESLINTIFYCYSSPIIGSVGVIGNILVFVIMADSRLLPNKTFFHSYIQALAITDLFFLLFNFVFSYSECKGFYNWRPAVLKSEILGNFLGRVQNLQTFAASGEGVGGK